MIPNEFVQLNREDYSTVSYLCNYVTPKERILDIKTRLSKLTIKRDLDLWAPAFCYCSLASGKIEAIVNDKIELYDFAAGKLIVLEAGARITDFSGNNIKDDTADAFVIPNGTSIHSTIVNNIT